MLEVERYAFYVHLDIEVVHQIVRVGGGENFDAIVFVDGRVAISMFGPDVRVLADKTDI